MNSPASKGGRLTRLRNLHGLPALAVGSFVLALVSQANIGRVAIGSKEALIQMQTALTWDGFLAVLEGWRARRERVGQSVGDLHNIT